MIRYPLYVLFFAMIFTACSKEDLGNVTTECIQVMMEAFKKTSDAKTVRRIQMEQEYHYWFNTDARFVDGPEYILNSKCDTVCIFGRLWPPQTCLQNYDDSKWVVIWTR